MYRSGSFIRMCLFVSVRIDPLYIYNVCVCGCVCGCVSLSGFE